MLLCVPTIIPLTMFLCDPPILFIIQKHPRSHIFFGVRGGKGCYISSSVQEQPECWKLLQWQ
jgi:hypothetical protein